MNPVTTQHLQRAFELAHRPDWPAETLADLLAAARRAELVRGLAQRLANGQGMALPEQPAALAHQPAPVPLRAGDYPPRRTAALAGGTHHRRASDGPDRKCLAAGAGCED